MAVLRKIKKKGNFIQVDNSLARNKNLSYEARGLLIDLLSRPENWEIHKKDLINESTGITKVTRILGELKRTGHLYVVQIRSSNNSKIEDRVWLACEEPQTEEGIKPYVKETLTIENQTPIQILSLL